MNIINTGNGNYRNNTKIICIPPGTWYLRVRLSEPGAEERDVQADADPAQEPHHPPQRVQQHEGQRVKQHEGQRVPVQHEGQRVQQREGQRVQHEGQEVLRKRSEGTT